MRDKTNYKSQKRLKKEAVVAELGQKVEKAKALVFTNYQGLTHQQLEKLKKTLRKLEAEFIVTKNTLLKIALKDKKNVEISEVSLNQPTATLFTFDDLIGPLKELTKAAKMFNLPTIKFGIFEGKLMSADDLNRLATLPSRDILIAQTIGYMKAPLSGLHRALNWNIQKFVFALQAVGDKKSQAPNSKS